MPFERRTTGTKLESRGASRKGAKTQRRAKPEFVLYDLLCDLCVLCEKVGFWF
jgi:hypothetical protein